MNTKKWKTKDGRKIRIKDMTLQHLKNTVKMLENQLEYNKMNMPYPCFNGDMAQMCAENEYDAFLESEPGDHSPIYDDMVEEINKREEVI